MFLPSLWNKRNKGVGQLVPGRPAATHDAYPRWKPFDDHPRHVESKIKMVGRVRLPVKLLATRYLRWISGPRRASHVQQSNFGVQHEVDSSKKFLSVIDRWSPWSIIYYIYI